MAEHVILGAGSIGTNVARLLADRGESVLMLTRSGSGPEHPLIQRTAADASDAVRLTELSRGAKVIYHAANPPSYTMWEQALAAGIRTLEVRGSDYIGKNAAGMYSLVIGPALDKGRTAWVPAHLDMPHTFTYNRDMATALVTLAQDQRAWGRAWHVPSPPAITLRELAHRYAAAAGKPPLKLVQMPRFAMHAAGVLVPIARETAEMDYQWYAPFHLDATETARTFGLTATDLDTAIRDQVAG